MVFGLKKLGTELKIFWEASVHAYPSRIIQYA